MFLTRLPRMPTHAPTGSTFSFGRMDRDLRAVTGLARQAADFHGAVVDLADLQFEEAADEIGVRAREDDLGPAHAVFHGHDVGAQAVADVVILRDDAFLAGHDGVEFAQVHDDIAALEPADGAADDLARAILEFVVHHLLLRRADALEHGLFGGLRGDAPEVARRHLDFHGIAHGRIGLGLLRLGEEGFAERVHDLLDHGEIGQRADLARLRVDVDAQSRAGPTLFFDA